MAQHVCMPRLSQDMTQGRIVKWLKQEGEAVKEGDPFVSIETDKAEMEVQSPGSGIVRRVLVGPVIFLEHKLLYGKKGEVPEAEYVVPIGKADVKRPGDGVTIVATGLMVDRALGAARSLAADGISAEVIDLRSIQPLDEDTILTSVEKTGRLVIVHEAPVRGGFGGEVAAVVATKALGYLDAPIQRVGAPWTPVPFGQILVDAYVPSEADIVRAVRATR